MKLDSFLPILSLAFLISTISNSGLIEPFEFAIERLKNNDFEKSAIDDLEAVKDNVAGIMQNAVEHWWPLVGAVNKNPAVGLNIGISKAFTTNPGKLVFKLEHFPSLIFKIDTKGEYIKAFEKTQMATQFLAESGLNDYDKILTPKMASINITAPDGKTYPLIISEEAKLFSSNDLDNQRLLLMMIDRSSDDMDLKEALSSLYLQAIDYVCRLDFGDINFRNLPFTHDGRLAAIDTDTGEAGQGVISILRDFYALSFFSDSLDSIYSATENCGKDRERIKNYIEKKHNVVEVSETYSLDLDKMKNDLNFLTNKLGDSSAKSPFTIPDELVGESNVEKDVANFIVDYVNERIVADDDKLLFGRRCWIGDISPASYIRELLLLINNDYKRDELYSAHKKITKSLQDGGLVSNTKLVSPNLIGILPLGTCY